MEDQTFTSLLFGQLGQGSWLGYCALFLLGTLLKYFVRTRNRQHQLTQFNWGYFWQDNWRKLGLIVICMWLFIRFYQYLSPILIENLPMDYSLPEPLIIVLCGYLLQNIVNWLANKTGMVPKENPLEYIERKTNN